MTVRKRINSNFDSCTKPFCLEITWNRVLNKEWEKTLRNRKFDEILSIKLRGKKQPANASDTFRTNALFSYRVTNEKKVDYEKRKRSTDYSRLTRLRSNLRTLEEGVRAHPTISSIGDVINPLSGFFLHVVGLLSLFLCSLSFSPF